MKKKAGRFIFLIILLCCISISSSRSQEMSKFHALFIQKFVQYIQWPNGNDKLVMGVIGSSAVTDEMKKLISSKGITNIEIRSIPSPAMVSQCDLVFIPSLQDKNFPLIKTVAKGKSILIITESNNFAEKGAGISFYMESDRLKFKVNKAVIESMNMRITGSLLNLATII